MISTFSLPYGEKTIIDNKKLKTSLDKAALCHKVLKIPGFRPKIKPRGKGRLKKVESLILF